MYWYGIAESINYNYVYSSTLRDYRNKDLEVTIRYNNNEISTGINYNSF